MFCSFSKRSDEELDGVRHSKVEERGRERSTEITLEDPAELSQVGGGGGGRGRDHHPCWILPGSHVVRGGGVGGQTDRAAASKPDSICLPDRDEEDEVPGTDHGSLPGRHLVGQHQICLRPGENLQ